MSFQMAVWGRLEFPAGGIEKWREAPIDYAELRGPRGGPFSYGDATARTVGEALELLSHIAGDPITITIGETLVELSGDLDEDQLRDSGRDLAGAILRAADVDGHGSVLVVEDMASFGYRFIVENHTSRLEDLGPKQIGALLAAEAGVARLPNPQIARLLRRHQKPKHRGKRPPVGPSPFSPEESRVHAAISAALRKADSDTITRAVHGAGTALATQRSDGQVVPLEELFSNGEDLRSALQHGDDRLSLSHDGARDDWFFGVGFRVLSRVNPASAAVIALDALKVAPECSLLRRRAIEALRRTEREDAIDTLVDILCRPRDAETADAAHALAANPNQQVGARVLALLPTGAVEEEPENFMLAKHIMEILGTRRETAALPRLLDIWRSGKNQQMRAAAGRALMQIGTPDALCGLLETKTRLRSTSEESTIYIQALFCLDPARAYDELAPLFAQEALAKRGGEALARRVFFVLGRDAVPETGDVSRGWLRADPRWVERGIPLLGLDIYGEDVLWALAHSGDPRVVPALQDLFGAIEPFKLYEAFRQLSRPEAIPFLEKRSKRVRKKDEVQALTVLIEALRDISAVGSQ